MAISDQVQAMVKVHYKDPTEVIFDPNDNELKLVPLFASCEMTSKEGFGKKIIVKSEYDEGSAASASATVSDTIAADGAVGSNPAAIEWELTAVSYDGSFTFHRDDIDACEGPGEQFKVITNRIDMALKRVRKRLSMFTGGDGTGALCQITAISSSTITVPRWATSRLNVGSRLTAATAVSGGTAYGTAIRVTQIVPRTGVVTLSADPTSTWANNSALYIFFEGDRGAVITGTKAWVDDTSTSLFNVTRTGIPELQGLVVSGSGMDTVEALTEIAEAAFYKGLEQDMMVVSGTTWKVLQREKDFQARVNPFETGNSKYRIGLKAFMLATVFGDLPVVPDVWMPAGECISGPFNNKKFKPRFYHNGANLVNIEGHDNLEFRRSVSAGSRTYSGNVYFRGQLAMTPGKFIRGTSLPTA